MAEVVVSTLLPILFEKLTSEAVKSIARYKGFDAEIKKWHKSLKQIQRVLADASKREITDDSVKDWLNDLQHLAYDIDDILDGWATDAMHRKFTHESEAIGNKVRKLIPRCCTNFSRSNKILNELESINTKLEDLFKEKVKLGLRVDGETEPRNNNRRFESCVFDPSKIVGRQAEKKALVQLLLANGPSHQKLDIVPIVGMGGVGKTTLAKLVYAEKQVKDHFELMGWVCISEEFDINGRTKDIFVAVGGEFKKELENFNKLHEALRDHVTEKKILLVLDDVWTESYKDWETLVDPLCTCARGSKIIITTRKDQLLNKLGLNTLNKQLKSLSDDDALSLFTLHALGVSTFDSHNLSLKPLAEGIVKKCGSLPLALKALGTSLRTKEDEDSWKKVLESEIWNLPVVGEILPALRLSYNELSAHLKQLFAFCSLFPKDFMFDKEELVLLWMAEGFLHRLTPSHLTHEEDMGRADFDELLSRSFFHHAPNNESLFMMHDSMNDLATYVAGEFFVRLDNDAGNNIREEKLRHMSFVCEEYVAYKNFESFKGAKSLRTFLATSVGVVDGWQRFYLSNKIMVDFLHELPFLRVLSLSNFNIIEVPESIGTLRHLRFLNLSQTKIEHLPEDVSDLYNLQTLILFGCWRLSKLPNNFLKLKNLRHLDIRNTGLLSEMPLGIGELKSLQTLSKIIIGGKSGFEITKLKDLENLCGEVSIEGLDNVQNAADARAANFPQKRLSKLKVVWSDQWNDARNAMLEKNILNELKPRNDKLTHLNIRLYGGLEFPNWVWDPLFRILKHVSLTGCKRCTCLPPLAKLPSLKELFIEDLDGVKVVGNEVLGIDCAFPSLEILSFKKMHGWEQWSTNNDDAFPQLKHLVIEDCPNLVEVSVGALKSLNALKIRSCDSGVLRRLVKVASKVTELNISFIAGLNDVVWRGVIEDLGEVEDLMIYDCKEIRYLWESEAVASNVLKNLRNLKVNSCGNLIGLGKENMVEDNCRNNFLTSLRSLVVYYCNNMERFSCPDSIETLNVHDCRSITSISLPTEGQKLKSLKIWGCDKLLEREWGGQKMNNNRSSMPVIELVWIYNWPNLKLISKLYCLVHLTRLSIVNCEGLESLPDNEFPNLTSLKHLQIIDCPRMDAGFPRGFWPPNLQSLRIGKLKKPISEWGSQNFPSSLVELELSGGEGGVSSCTQFSNVLPSSLTYLELSNFEKLESFSTQLQNLKCLTFRVCPNLNKLSHTDPQHLISIQHLCFSHCPNMMDLPEELLPSLLSLKVYGDCPKLKERCCKGGSYWPLISHISCIDI